MNETVSTHGWQKIAIVALIHNILILISDIPGLLLLGAVCAVFRSSCYIGRSLGTDQAAWIVVLLGNAAFYMVITYWIARLIQTKATTRARWLQSAYVATGVFALLANCVLTTWMIWARTPYYAHPLPRLSILSLIVAVVTFLSLFRRVGSHALEQSS